MRFNFGFAIATCFLLASCAKEVTTTIAETEPVTTVFTARSNETRTVFGEKDNGGYPVLWTNGTVKAILSYTLTNDKGTSQSSSSQDADLTANATGSEGTFSTTFSPDPQKSNYEYFAVSPSTAFYNYSGNGVQIDIPDSQKPLASSVAENAQVLVAADSEGPYDELQSSIDFNFNHAVAYAKMTLTNLTIPEGATVTNYVVTASSNISGRWYYNDGVLTESTAKSSITIDPSNVSNGIVWFALAPADLRGGSLKISVNTSAGVIEKNIQFPAGGAAGKFQLGHVSPFSVNMAGIAPQNDVVYTLVENASELVLGCQVIIVANGSDNIAMSTAQNSNNRGSTTATKSADFKTITNPSDDVQVFTLEKGSASNSFAFHCVNGTVTGYIYAASSTKNYLRTQSDIDNNASWTISINDRAATIAAQGSNSRNLLKYNSSDNLFSCYASGQQSVWIYQKTDGGSPVDPQPTVNAPTFNPNGGIFTSSQNVTISSTTTGATIYYTLDGSTPTASTTTTVANGGTVSISTSCTLKAIAVKEGVSSSVSSADFTINNSYYSSPVSFTTSDFEGQGVSQSGGGLEVVKTPITVSSDKGYGTDVHVRIYQGGTITVTASNKTITKVVITCTAKLNSDYGPGKLSLPTSQSGTYTTSSYDGIWTGNANSVSLTASKQVRFTSIEVTYK